MNVYCEWLSALYQVPRISVPRPICEDPNLYARKMINHFHKLFVPRQGEGEFILAIHLINVLSIAVHSISLLSFPNRFKLNEMLLLQLRCCEFSLNEITHTFFFSQTVNVSIC